jgi:hypothetical protein
MPLGDYTPLDAKGLAEKWAVPESWIRNQTRASCPDPIPHVKLGRYVRFEWPSRSLYLWWRKHRRAISQVEEFPEAAIVLRQSLSTLPRPKSPLRVHPVIRRKP